MANYSIGTATQFDALPLIPTIDTTNGGIRLNSNISMAIGAKVEFDGLRFSSLTFPDARILTDSIDAIMPRFGAYSNTNESTITGFSNTSGIPSYPIAINASVFQQITVVSTLTSNVGTLFSRGNGTYFARCRSKGITVKDASGSVVWQWLNQVSDYKSTPPNASIVGTLVWGKSGIESNYLTPALFLSAVTNPTEPVTVYILDKSTDVSSIPSTINGQPVTISYQYVSNKSFDFGFNFNF